MPIRILHCADLHLDSPLHGSDLPDTLPRDLLVQAPRRAFEDLVREAISRLQAAGLVARRAGDGAGDGNAADGPQA